MWMRVEVWSPSTRVASTSAIMSLAPSNVSHTRKPNNVMANRTAPHISSTVTLVAGHCWHVSPRAIGAYPSAHWWHNSDAVALWPMAQLPFENELLHANAIGHAPNVWASHDIARYPFKGRNVANVGKGSSAVQSAPSGQATHSHALLSWSVSFKYSPTLQAPHGGNSHPVPSSLGTFPEVRHVSLHFVSPLES